MSFFNRLFGKKDPQQQPLDQGQFLRAFEQFVNADTWSESQRIVEQQPILLHPDGDDLLRQLAASQTEPQVRQLVEEHRVLLQRCREAGIEAAFGEKTGGSGGGIDVSTGLQSILQELGQPARLTDMARRAGLCRQALTMLTRDENPRLWAALQVELGNSLAQSLSGDRAQNLEEAIAAYRQALDRVNQRQNGLTTRGGASSKGLLPDYGWRSMVTTAESVRSGPVTRYTDIQLPARVQVDRRFAVVVGLTVTPSPDSADVQPVTAPAGQVVRVVLAPCASLEVLGERMRELRVKAALDSDPAVFYLRANAVGQHDLGIEFWLGGQIAASSRHSIEAVAEAAVELPSRPASQSIEPGLAAAPYPDLVLRVTTTGNRLHYDLHFADVRFVSVPGEALRTDPETFRYELIRRIEALAKEAQRRHNDAAAIQAALEQEGQNLYKQLFSDDLRREYRSFWRQVRTLQIISDEPWIPWERIKPYDDEKDELLDHDFLCMQFELARWFTPAKAAAPVIRVGSLATIAPTDSRLAAAQEERADMARLAQARALFDRSPALPTRQAVLDDLLKGQEPVHLWHFACHGDFDGQTPADSPLILQDKERLIPRDVVGRAQTRLKEDRPLVVFNACRVGQSGLALTSMGGWARVLVKDCAVGALVAPMWEVNDAPARAFAAAFYRATLEIPGCTLAQAVRVARQTIRAQTPHDPTWLAYSIYAHPNARLVWDGSRG